MTNGDSWPGAERDGGLLLFRFRGVPILLSGSWWIGSVAVIVLYAPLVERFLPGAGAITSMLLAGAFAVLLGVSVLAHELGHCVVALQLGIPVRRLRLFLLGGLSEIARTPRRPMHEGVIAAAGPAVSALLAGVCGVALLFLPAEGPVWLLVLECAVANVAVAVFNLLPGLPLDGGRLLRATVWAISRNRLVGTRAGAWSGRLVAGLVAVSGLVADRSTWGLTAGIFGVALAAYLWYGASQSLRVAEIMEHVPNVNLETLLRPGLLVPSDVSVAEALRRAWTGNARGLVVVDAAEQPRAIVDELQIGAVPLERRPWTQLDSVSRPLEPGLVLDVRLHGEDLLAAVRATPAHEYLVVNTDGTPAGILTTADLAAALKGPA